MLICGASEAKSAKTLWPPHRLMTLLMRCWPLTVVSGVGQIGTDDAVALLSRNVPGYSVTNPKDAALLPPSLRTRLPFEQVF